MEVSGFLFVVIFISTLAIIIHIQISGSDRRMSNKTKRLAEQNWEMLEARISTYFSDLGFQWITVNVFNDIATEWNVNIDQMRYVLIKFAIKCPGEAIFGIVFDIKTREPVTSSEVLISLDNINKSEFRF